MQTDLEAREDNNVNFRWQASGLQTMQTSRLWYTSRECCGLARTLKQPTRQASRSAEN